MRNAFADELEILAKENEKVVLLSGDIGNRMFDSFQEAMPDRFYNCGVAEASMMSIAAGLALNGFRPFVYTITPFMTLRCLEQIKLDVCYHEAPVTIVGTGSGLSYAGLGPTHHSLDDINVMRVLPNMAVVCPCDTHEVRAGLSAVLNLEHPVFFRLGKKGEKPVHLGPLNDFEIGKSITVKNGKNVCIIAVGNVVQLSVDVANLLDNSGISTCVESFHTVKPLDLNKLGEMFKNYELVCVIEEHSSIGGLFSAIAEWLIVNAPRNAFKLLQFSMEDKFYSEVSSQVHLREKSGLDLLSIEKKIRSHLEVIRE